MMEDTAIGFPLATVLVFLGLSLGAIFIDLYMHRDNKPISLKKAVFWTLFWILISLIFAVFLYFQHGSTVASLFITGYALEKVLSVDNLFVIMAIFSWFAIPDGYRHRILYWGILGAIVFRGLFVAIGTGLLAFGPWIEIAFATIVAWTAIIMLKNSEDDEQVEDYSQHLAYRAVKWLFPVWPRLKGNAFLLTQAEVNAERTAAKQAGISLPLVKKGAYYATPLLLCLAVVELSDVMFAFDSVPAVIAVSREPLIIYSAMMFAILGLRTLYFVLEAMKRYLVHLEKAVIVLLFFIAAKLALNASSIIFNHSYTLSANISLLVVLTVLSLGILASLCFPAADEK